MRRYTKRLTKKYCKRVSDGLWDDTITSFYARKVQLITGRFLDRKYLTVFRPTIYDGLREFVFKDEYNKHYETTLKEFQSLTGVHLGMFNSYLKTLPKRKQTRKPRKVKVQPIKQLKNPQEFFITNRIAGKLEKKSVVGELAFSFKGYDFFIYRDGDFWNVSDVAAGARICWYKGYYKAVQRAQKLIKRKFDKYVENVKKLA